MIRIARVSFDDYCIESMEAKDALKPLSTQQKRVIEVCTQRSRRSRGEDRVAATNSDERGCGLGCRRWSGWSRDSRTSPGCSSDRGTYTRPRSERPSKAITPVSPSRHSRRRLSHGGSREAAEGRGDGRRRELVKPGDGEDGGKREAVLLQQQPTPLQLRNFTNPGHHAHR